jgi:gamma-glutamylputrescine oxidase
VAWGASGRNGGFVSAGYATGLSAIERRVGADGARELFRLSMEGAEIVRRHIDGLGIHEAHPVTGIAKALRYNSRGALQAASERQQREFGLSLRYLPREEVRGLFASPKYHEALLDEGAFHFHPLNYGRALAHAAVRQGAAIHEGSAVLSADLDGPRKILRTKDAEIALVMWCSQRAGIRVLSCPLSGKHSADCHVCSAHGTCAGSGAQRHPHEGRYPG